MSPEGGTGPGRFLHTELTGFCLRQDCRTSCWNKRSRHHPHHKDAQLLAHSSAELPGDLYSAALKGEGAPQGFSGLSCDFVSSTSGDICVWWAVEALTFQNSCNEEVESITAR